MAPSTAPRKASSGRWLNILLVVAAAVAIGGVAFAVGRNTAPASAAFPGNFPGNGTFQGNGTFPGGPNASGAPGGNGGTRGFGLGGGGLTISGTVESVTADTMTVTTANGQTIEVTLDGETAYHQQAPATASDVTAGSSVSVQVTTGGFGPGAGNGDGSGTGTAPSVTASDVTVVP
jgi:hypothetical protein